MKQFNNTVILTSKNPEAFLNFAYSLVNAYIIPECSIGEGILFVNGLDVTEYETSLGYALLLDSDNTRASFHVYSEKNYNWETNLTFKVYSTPDLLTPTLVDVSIKNRPFIIPEGLVNTFSNENPLIDDEASYLIMRTSPKFTGNVKLYVDGSHNIFLDTFKVSDTLSNKKYRHQQISGSSVLSGDIRKVFSSLPLGELYRVDVDNTLEIGIPKTDLKNQYNTTYNYGARLLKDELYSEDNGILAPLWINSKLPSHFGVFRLKGNYNPETYDSSILTDLAFKYLEDSNLIKSWSLLPESPLGKYLSSHMADVVKIQAPVFLSLTDPDIAIAESDPNTWYGIAVDKGVVTGRSETPYFFNQKAENFTELNAFVTDGFERNNLLCPNLINLEFVFSDEDVSLYSMDRYFGLYLTENILYNIAYYSDSPSGPVEILSLDGKDSSVFLNSTVFDLDGTVSDEYANRIFVLNDGKQLKRIYNVNEVNDTVINSYLSKPHQNLFSAPVEVINTMPFITLTLNSVLEQGEHLRVINVTENKIWEIYSVDASAFKCERYCTISENPGYPTLYRTFFDVNGDISYQIKQIEEAFDLFSEYGGTPFRSGVRGSNWVTILLNNDADESNEWIFQRISAPTLNDFSDPSSGFNTASSPGDITFFGRFTPDSSDFGVVAYNDIYGPIDFELYGNRQTIFVNFIKQGNNYLYSFERKNDILDKFQQPTLYQGADGWYRRIQDFEVSTNLYQYIKDPVNSEDRVIVMTAERAQLLSGKLNTYSIWPLNLSLMGINPVKDIDYTVYDQSIGFESEYKYNRECDASSYEISIPEFGAYALDIPGSYIIASGQGTKTQGGITAPYIGPALINTFDSSILFQASTATTITYAILDGSYAYKGYKDGSAGNEEDLLDYYYSKTLLKYGLTIPLVSKWAGLGNDCRNNPFRLILNDDILDVSTNFIPDGNNFYQEISYPSFKYLTPCNRTWEDYIFYDINDVIQDGSIFMTFKDAMFAYPYDDYFSKLIYSNYNVDATKTRSSIAYYNQYKNTIDILFMGLNLSIKVENIAKNTLDIKNYNRYRFSFISTPSRNKNGKRPIEVIINENTRTILMIWYQGNDELNYNKRYSTYLPGKSLLDPANNGFVTGPGELGYSFVKTPYYVNNSTIQKTIERFYDAPVTYGNDTARPYAQFNKNLNGFWSAWNAFGNNIITGNIFNVDSNRDYNTFPQYVEYNYAQNPNTFGDYVMNYGYNYNNNKNWYINNTTNLDTLKFLLSSSRFYVMYYIIRGDEVYDSYDFGSNINPITITVNPPRTYRGLSTYNGWFKPKFNSIFEFKADEDAELVNITKKDFTFSNTNLRLYKDIPQLWYNKVVTQVDAQDVSDGNAISFIKNFNVFKALWDADYYTRDNLLVDGYESADELPSFFGSKLPKFPNQINLEKWDITTAAAREDSQEIVLNFNLTRAILSLFKTNSAFLSNWASFSNTDNVIDSYVKNTILTYYNISQPKIGVNFYYKSYDSNLLFYTYSDGFINDGKQNFNGQLMYENDEYIYKIVIPKTGKFSYFVSFTLTEK